MDNDAVTIVRSAFSTQAIRSAKSYLPQTDNLGHAKKKKKVGTPRVVSGRRRPHASYAPDSGLKLLQLV